MTEFGLSGRRCCAPSRRPRWRNLQFLDKKLYEGHDNQRSTRLGGGRDTQRLRFFVNGKLHGVKGRRHIESELLGDLADAVGTERADRVRLFAAFDGNGRGAIDSGALVIDLGKCAKDGSCPVFMYSDSKLVKVAPSIATLLASMEA